MLVLVLLQKWQIVILYLSKDDGVEEEIQSLAMNEAAGN